MSSEMSILEHMQLAKEIKGCTEFLHMVAKEEDGAYNEEPITINEVQVYDMYYQVICYARTLCSSYQIICLHCMCAGIFAFNVLILMMNLWHLTIVVMLIVKL